MTSGPHLVIGAAGMLGVDMVNTLRSRGLPIVEAAWPQATGEQILLNLTNTAAVEELFARIRPAVVYNCSAYTNVDAAETDEANATLVNGHVVGHLAQWCKNHHSFLVHVSTDYVFDGQSTRPYQPDTPTNPKTAYGRSKLAGEQAIQATGGQWLIVRTSWLYGQHGKNFVSTILSFARQKPSLRVVNDQRGCPTYAPELARCLADLAATGVQGLHHFCNPPDCTWFDFAAQAVELAGLPCQVEPCTTAEFPRPAPRPAYSVLDCRTTTAHLHWQPSPWPATLQDYLRQL